MDLLRSLRMKTVLITCIASFTLCLTGCQTVDGKKYYVGPKIRFDINVKGIGLGITLYDPLNPEDPRIIEIPLQKTESGTAGKEPVQK